MSYSATGPETRRQVAGACPACLGAAGGNRETPFRAIRRSGQASLQRIPEQDEP
jgi:hypothetical protein